MRSEILLGVGWFCGRIGEAIEQDYQNERIKGVSHAICYFITIKA